jgi:hypothetical protein
LCPLGASAKQRDCWKRQCRQDRNDCDDDQQFEKRKCAALRILTPPNLRAIAACRQPEGGVFDCLKPSTAAVMMELTISLPSLSVRPSLTNKMASPLNRTAERPVEFRDVSTFASILPRALGRVTGLALGRAGTLASKIPFMLAAFGSATPWIVPMNILPRVKKTKLPVASPELGIPVVKTPIEFEEKGSVGSNDGCNTPA